MNLWEMAQWSRYPAVVCTTPFGFPVVPEVYKITATSSFASMGRDCTTSPTVSSSNLNALTALFAATVGSPVVKVAAFTYGVRSAMNGAGDRKGSTHRRRRRG